jgi:hypothetical protein
MLQVGFSREVITPVRGIPLCGYFNPRPNAGILDDLFVRAVIFKQGRVTAGLVVFDLCLLSTDIIDRIKAGLKAAGINFGDNLIFSPTHTHTGPYIYDMFSTKADAAYLEFLTNHAVCAIRRAYAGLAPAELLIGSVKSNPLAFNRRYWMNNGRVVTNPGKLNPAIVKPEGSVDTEIGVLAVRQGGRISAILANIVNHADTIGGNLVSADWPGRMERAIQNSIGYDAPVLTLIGCSGNINHFDVSTKKDQSGYAEACRIGAGYAGIVAGLLKKLKKLPVETLQITSSKVTIPFRVISAGEVKQAKTVLARIGNAAAGSDMTSEGLASGDGPVAKFFAEQLIEYKKTCSGKSRQFTLVSLKFGDSLALTALPGEPFTEVGLEIKKRSPFKKTWPVTPAMGYCGYISLPECFGRGGYEILPVAIGGPAEDTAIRLIEATLKNLK